jgi:hypothetical protein
LSEFSIQQLPALEYFLCNDCYTPFDLDFSASTSLLALCCFNTGISGLDTATNTKLKHLNISNTLVGYLDLSTNVDLTYLNCEVCNAPRLNLSNNKKLTTVAAGGGALTGLDVTPLTGLQFVDVSFCNFSTATVNSLLSQLSANVTGYGVTSGYADMLSMDVPVAPPSHGPPDGIAAKQTLTAYGWTVITD